MPSKSTSPKPSRKAPGAALPRPTPSEAAFERAFAALDGPAPVEKKPQAPLSSERDAFVERVFAAGESYLRDPYSTIGDAAVFHSKLVGVSFEGRQDVISGLRVGSDLELERQPDNPYDANAIAVRYGNLQVGYIRREIAAHLGPRIDEGARYRARIASLTGGPSSGSGQTKHRGVNIVVERDGSGEPRRRTARVSPDANAPGDVLDRIREALIGSATPHEAQNDVLYRLER
ncbi:MAG TPA: HIRAN domain-containing protein, partial [Candidatus Acidoferrales bacterium]|nr:HIRAN domain-containing protein [Candidatus Acidoferrales bacterium]